MGGGRGGCGSLASYMSIFLYQYRRINGSKFIKTNKRVYIYIDTYIEREREKRERERPQEILADKRP